MGLEIMPAARKSVCVLGGSRFGSDPAYAAAAVALGSAVAGAGLRLVYGAGDAGLVAAAARAAAEAGGATLGVIPAHLVRGERRDPGGASEIVVTETMHERKKVMFMNADAFVVLPGGAGTLDHIVEVMTWRQLGLHRKPLYLLNVAGFWDPLLALLDHLVAAAFAEPRLVNDIETFDAVEALVERVSATLHRRPIANA
jgi:uncharacterized protein (TIGR00730 family)